MSFRDSVQAVPALADAYQQGLQAMEAGHRNRVVCARPRRLKGSVHIDKALEVALPNDPRWDYGIGHYNGQSEEAIWIEVHPASSDRVSRVTRKAHWLRNWLRQNGVLLLNMTRISDGFVWLSSGGVSIQRGSRQARELALAGVSFPRKRLDLN
jgi:hypothetical protein